MPNCLKNLVNLVNPVKIHLNPNRGRINSKILKRYLGRSIGKQQK